MGEKNNTELLMDVLRECLEKVDSEIEIQPALLASCAVKLIDPEKLSPKLVEWAANLELRQLARGLLRKKFDPIAEDNPQAEMFECLQDRYPTKRNGEPTYVLLDELTEDEIQENLNRMAREINAKQKHYDALQAYWLSKAA